MKVYIQPQIFVNAPTPAGQRMYKCRATEAAKKKKN